MTGKLRKAAYSFLAGLVLTGCSYSANNQSYLAQKPVETKKISQYSVEQTEKQEEKKIAASTAALPNKPISFHPYLRSPLEKELVNVVQSYQTNILHSEQYSINTNFSSAYQNNYLDYTLADNKQNAKKARDEIRNMFMDDIVSIAFKTDQIIYKTTNKGIIFGIQMRPLRVKSFVRALAANNSEERQKNLDSAVSKLLEPYLILKTPFGELNIEAKVLEGLIYNAEKRNGTPWTVDWVISRF